MLSYISAAVQSRVATALASKVDEKTGRPTDEGATAVEYGLMAALIAVVIIAGVTTVGENLLDLFENEIAPALVVA